MPILTFPASRPTVLPAGSVLLRVITGDSLAGVIDTDGVPSTSSSAVSLLTDDSLRIGRDLRLDTTFESDAYYWSRWLHKESGGYAQTRRLSSTAPSDEKWEQLTDRSGWNYGGPYVTIDTALDVPLAWLIHKWAQQIGHGYVDEAGAPVPVYYIIFGSPASILARGAAWNVAWDSAVSGNTPYNLFVNNYLTPAIASLKTISRLRVARHLSSAQPEALARIESRIYCDMMLFTAGGADSAVAYSSTGATALGTNLALTLADLHGVLGCRPPTIALRPFDPGVTSGGTNQYPHVSLAQASFDALMAAAEADGRASYLMEVDLSSGIETQEYLSPGAFTVTYGIHPTPDGAMEFARRVVVTLAERSGGDFGSIDGGSATGLGAPPLVRFVP